jgi:S1-C subfamily serine protease
MRPTRSCLFLLLLATAAGAAQPPAGWPDVRSIARDRGGAVVRVETFEHYLAGVARRTGRLLNPFPISDTLGDAVSFVIHIPSLVFYPLRRHLGAGVLIDPEGYLLTNYHVVRDADRFTIRLKDAKGRPRRFAAKRIGIDPETDIALLKIDPGDVPLVTAPFGDPEQLALGDWVVAIGNPVNLTGTVTVGIVSGLHRQLEANDIEDYIQVSAALNPGNSGGPILNTAGEIVGIATLGIMPANNIGFAVPVTLIAPHLDDLKRTGRPQRGRLGISVAEITPELGRKLKLDVDRGVLVTRVGYFSTAREAGIQEGDLIVEVGGRQVAKPREVYMAVLRSEPDTRIPVVVRRGGKVLTLTARVAIRRRPFSIF